MEETWEGGTHGSAVHTALGVVYRQVAVHGVVRRMWPELAQCTQFLYERSGGEAKANTISRHATC